MVAAIASQVVERVRVAMRALPAAMGSNLFILDVLRCGWPIL